MFQFMSQNKGILSLVPSKNYLLAKNLNFFNLWLELSKSYRKQWPVWAVDVGAGLEQEADEERLTGLAGKVKDVPTLVIHLTSDLLLLKTTAGTILSLEANLLEFHIFIPVIFGLFKETVSRAVFYIWCGDKNMPEKLTMIIRRRRLLL